MPRPKPEPTRRQRWLPYVRQIADTIALRDWRIEIEEDLPTGNDSNASLQPLVGRKYAILRLGDQFFALSPTDQRHTLIHELIHCHQSPFLAVLQRNNLSESVTLAIMLANEYTTDGLADGFAHLLPLPKVK